MHVLDGNGQADKLIDEPRRVEHSFVLVNRHDVIAFVKGSIAKACEQVVVADNGLLHVFETQVAHNMHNALRVEIQLEKLRCLADSQCHIELSFPHVGSVDGFKVVIGEMVAEHCHSLLQPLQIYL